MFLAEYYKPLSTKYTSTSGLHIKSIYHACLHQTHPLTDKKRVYTKTCFITISNLISSFFSRRLLNWLVFTTYTNSLSLQKTINRIWLLASTSTFIIHKVCPDVPKPCFYTFFYLIAHDSYGDYRTGVYNLHQFTQLT